MKAWPCPTCGAPTTLVSIYHLLWSEAFSLGLYAGANCENDHHSTVSDTDEGASIESFLEDLRQAYGVDLAREETA